MWLHRRPTFNRGYSNPLCHAECASLHGSSADVSLREVESEAVGPDRPLSTSAIVSPGPLGWSLVGVRQGPSVAPHAPMDGPSGGRLTSVVGLTLLDSHPAQRDFALGALAGPLPGPAGLPEATPRVPGVAEVVCRVLQRSKPTLVT